MSANLRGWGSVSIVILLAAFAAFFVPCGQAGAQGFPDAPLEVLGSATVWETVQQGVADLEGEIPFPAGTEMVILAVSGASRGFSFIDYVSVGGGMEQIAETDGMAALDMATSVWYRTFPTPPVSDTTAELIVGIDTAYQDPFPVVVTAVCLRGADMTSFPGVGTAYTGLVYEASGSVGEVEYTAPGAL